MTWTSRRMRIITAGVLAAAAIPAAASAHHQTGHTGGGGGGGTGTANNVSIAATSPIVWSRSATISGKVTGNGNSGVAVELEADPFPYAENGFARVATGTTDANGDYRFTLTQALAPKVNTRYRVVARTSPPATSPIATVNVRVRVSRKVSDRTPEIGTRIRFAGKACPEHDGKLAYIQRRTSTGSYRTVARTTLRDTGGVCSKYARKIRIRRDGTYRVRVRPEDGDHLPGTSRRIRIDAHR